MTKTHVCHVFPAFATGGPEVRTCSLIDSSADQFRHTVISLNGNLTGRGRIGCAEEVTFLDASQNGGQVANAVALRRLLRELRPKLVLTYGWGGTDAAAVARLSGFSRVIHTEDGFLPDECQRQKFKRLLARRLMLRLAARVVVPSQTLLRIATQSWWLSPRNVRYFPNGVDTARFSPPPHETIQAIRGRLGFAAEDVVIGSAGHLRAEKNQLRLLEAFARIAARRPARLLLLGDGPLRETLIRRAEKLGVAERVVLTGVVSDPSQYYPAMDLLAMSSDTEQMPLAVLEAMAMGLPIVSTDVGDVKSMVSDENQHLVTPLGNEEEYLGALLQLVDHPQDRVRLGRANREKCVRQFDFESMVKAYLNLYQEVLAN